MDDLAAHYENLKTQRAAQEREREEVAAELAQRRQVLAALEWTKHFSMDPHDPRRRPGDEELEFGRAWADQWLVLAVLLREGLGMTALDGVFVPDEPSFQIAARLFDRALGGCDLEYLAPALQRAMDEFRSEREGMGPGLTWWGLREFFSYLTEHVEKLWDASLAVQDDASIGVSTSGAGGVPSSGIPFAQRDTLPVGTAMCSCGELECGWATLDYDHRCVLEVLSGGERGRWMSASRIAKLALSAKDRGTADRYLERLRSMGLVETQTGRARGSRLTDRGRVLAARHPHAE